MSLSRSLLRFLFLLSLLSLPASAQQSRLEEALLVSLPVSVNAVSEEAGKKKASRLALRTTFREVLHRFVVDEAGALALVQRLSEKQITALSETLIVETADFDGERFTGQVSVRFVLKKLFARLHKENLNISYSVAPSFVLIPVFVRDGKKELWPPRNPWLSAWKTESSDRSWLVPITPVEANASERLAILDTVKDLRSMQAALLAQQYRAQGVALLTASLETDAEKPSALTLNVSGVLNQKGFPSELPSFVLEQDSTDKNAADVLTELLIQARIATLYRLNRLWKEHTAHAAKRRRLRIVAELRSREEWTIVESLLAATPEIVEFGLRSLSARQAHVVAHYYTSPQLLKAALEQRGLTALNAKDDLLTVMLANSVKGSRNANVNPLALHAP